MNEVPPSPYVISYFADDLVANRRFYEEVVGLAVHTELPDVYFLAGVGPWRLQIIQIVPGRPGREVVSSGLILLGVETQEDLEAIHARARTAGLEPTEGAYLDPDGRLVMAQVYDAKHPFHN